ncbi:nicotinate-nucleotide adenylyltransferase [Bacillus sp. FJAT-44742]|uniref:nicotinate-nucleotide adenylyltransferase n=1 Tax=Bacillus sp. FJAT-44742 TaxID=2014005 RepID=UPI001E53A341|nr:nicotinate-nucleotide adenylyltransferase [Bacillus sp. FJAT-44742]
MAIKVGILGGTFDPPHHAHLMIAQEALTECGLDEVWFIPVNVPPHKQRSSTTSNRQRKEMIQLAINDNPFFKLSTIELERGGPSFTIDTIKQLKKENPSHEYYFIIGGDMAEQLDTWHEINALKKLVTFTVAARPPYKSSPPFQEGILIMEAPQLDVSSTDIRLRVKMGKNIQYLVPDSVREYIKERGLYE